MKANKLSCKDLMIGDWVYNTHNQQNEQVAEIGSGLVMLAYNGLFEYDEIEPIPLTPEILEKNGMHLYNRKTNSLMEECNHSGIFEEDDDYRVELSLGYDGIIRWTINGDEYTIMPLDYVHQLQQALRLCGIEKEIIL